MLEHHFAAMTKTSGAGIEIDDREKVVREIAKTSESIRKKYRALKTGRIEEDMILERQLKPIINPLKQIAENVNSEKSDTSVEEISAESANATQSPDRNVPLRKKLCKTKRSNVSIDHSLLSSTPIDTKRRFTNMPSSAPIISHGMSRSCETSSAHSPHADENVPREPSSVHSPYVNEDIFETSNDPLATSVRRELQTFNGQEMLRTHFGKLGQKYVGEVMRSDKNNEIDYVYGVYFSGNGMMLGDKRFDVDKNDNIFIGDVRYVGTPGIYELIFKRIPDDAIYTEADKEKYRNILLTTNAHRREHDVRNPILGNKGYKYKHIIGPLLFQRKVGRGFTESPTMILSNNSIDYVYWNDPNELVDRLRLLEASRHAGNNTHGNEFQSIIEELREAGFIIN